MSIKWNPSLYMKNYSHRLKPAIDLLTGVRSCVKDVELIKDVADLGCGTGNSLPYLLKAFPKAKICGVDNSHSMIEAASEKLLPGQSIKINFLIHDIESFFNAGNTNKYDIVYSNAALHWIPNHADLLANILSYGLNSGGVFGMQIPDTINQSSHVLMDVALRNCGFEDICGKARIPRKEKSYDWYLKLLHPYCSSIDMWSTEYVQQLEISNSDCTTGPFKHPVYEFTAATGLQPYVAALGGEMTDQCQIFLHEYQKLLQDAYPIEHFGETSAVLLPYRRFFLICTV